MTEEEVRKNLNRLKINEVKTGELKSIEKTEEQAVEEEIDGKDQEEKVKLEKSLAEREELLVKLEHVRSELEKFDQKKKKLTEGEEEVQKDILETESFTEEALIKEAEKLISEIKTVKEVSVSNIRGDKDHLLFDANITAEKVNWIGIVKKKKGLVTYVLVNKIDDPDIEVREIESKDKDIHSILEKEQGSFSEQLKQHMENRGIGGGENYKVDSIQIIEGKLEVNFRKDSTSEDTEEPQKSKSELEQEEVLMEKLIKEKDHNITLLTTKEKKKVKKDKKKEKEKEIKEETPVESDTKDWTKEDEEKLKEISEKIKNTEGDLENISQSIAKVEEEEKKQTEKANNLSTAEEGRTGTINDLRTKMRGLLRGIENLDREKLKDGLLQKKDITEKILEETKKDFDNLMKKKGVLNEVVEKEKEKTFRVPKSVKVVMPEDNVPAKIIELKKNKREEREINKEKVETNMEYSEKELENILRGIKFKIHELFPEDLLELKDNPENKEIIGFPNWEKVKAVFDLAKEKLEQQKSKKFEDMTPNEKRLYKDKLILIVENIWYKWARNPEQKNLQSAAIGYLTTFAKAIGAKEYKKVVIKSSTRDQKTEEEK